MTPRTRKKRVQPIPTWRPLPPDGSPVNRASFVSSDENTFLTELERFIGRRKIDLAAKLHDQVLCDDESPGEHSRPGRTSLDCG